MQKHTNFEVEQYSAPMSLLEIGLCVLVVLFIIALTGSMIWGNEGFVEVVASFF